MKDLPALRGRSREIEVLGRLLADPAAPPAILISGPTGVGTTRMALFAARMHLCQGSGSPGPCGDCAPCGKSLRIIHPDLHVYVPHGALGGGSHRAQEARYQDHRIEVLERMRAGGPAALRSGGTRYSMAAIRLMRREVMRPADHPGGPRSVVLDRADALRDAATQNAVLKLLEEPPSGMRILLTAGSGGELLDTVRSRLVEIRLPGLSDRDMAAVASDLDLDVPADEIGAYRGRPGSLVRLLDEEAAVERARAEGWLEMITGGDPGDLAELARSLSTADSDGQVERTLRQVADRVDHEHPDLAPYLIGPISRGLAALRRGGIAPLVLYTVTIQSRRALAKRPS